MSSIADRLYQLLPAIHRIRDKEQGEPLKALLSVIVEQVAILEEDLAQLYDDQFIETCAPWVVPYIGDLIGVKGLRGVERQNVTPRAEVAHTIGYRRRKGTAAVLEQIARDVTGWPARAVEFFQILATTQYLNHLRWENKSFIDLRDADRLESLGGAFEHLAGAVDLTHNVDVRRIAGRRGRYNIPNLGLFLWRLRAYSLTASPAVSDTVFDDQRHFRFSPLGNDIRLFNLPVTEDEITHLAEPVNVPDRISRRLLARNLEDYYGVNKSILLNVDGKDLLPDPNDASQKLSDIIKVCDLSDWKDQQTDKIAIDPMLGRMLFPEALDAPLLVTFHYGFSANMGGGEYDRATTFENSSQIKKVPDDFPTIQEAIDDLGKGAAIIEITDNRRYEETITINATGRRIEMRAADQCRPTLLLGADLEITGSSEDSIAINGLLITGGSLKVSGGLGHLYLRHCTLTPGITISTEGIPSKPTSPSLIITDAGTIVEIDDSIVGGVRAVEESRVFISNSIVDATEITGIAFAGLDGESAGGALQIENSTIIGKLHTVLMELASNTIFISDRAKSDDASKWPSSVVVIRRQQGCIRFSYLPIDAVVPRRYRCQPESETDAGRVRPIFASLRYGDAEYCQLRPDCPGEIQRGSDDESEMGAFHNLYQPQREAHLRTRLNEYLRFGLEAGIFYRT